MRNEALAIVVAAGTMGMMGGPTRGADLNGPAYYPPAAVEMPYLPYRWSGFYLGANLGGIWSDGRITDTASGTTWTDSQSNFTGGGQLGYNYQIRNFVIGVEAGMNWGSAGVTSQQLSIPSSGIVQASASNDWVGTLSARAGFAADNWLFYGKAGGAWAHGTTRVANLTTGVTADTSDTTSGWLAGGGIEYALNRNWTARLDYSYIGLNDRTGPGPLGNGNVTFGNDIQLLTFGINYKF